MFSLTILKVLLFISALQLTLASVIGRPPSPLITEETREEFERQAHLETEEFLNSLFQNQIDFFIKVKASLQPDSQRYKDIEAFVEKLHMAKEEQDLSRKDEIYWNSFKKSTLLLNDPDDTGLDNDEYHKILVENGVKDLLTNFLVDVAAYFWKMAKHSGKIVETAIDRFIENMQNDKVAF